MKDCFVKVLKQYCGVFCKNNYLKIYSSWHQKLLLPQTVINPAEQDLKGMEFVMNFNHPILH